MQKLRTLLVSALVPGGCLDLPEPEPITELPEVTGLDVEETWDGEEATETADESVGSDDPGPGDGPPEATLVVEWMPGKASSGAQIHRLWRDAGQRGVHCSVAAKGGDRTSPRGARAPGKR